MRREHRRELKHDKFVDEMGSLSSRVKENQRFLLMITVAVVAAALAAYGMYFYRNNREQQAQDAISAYRSATRIAAGSPGLALRSFHSSLSLPSS